MEELAKIIKEHPLPRPDDLAGLDFDDMADAMDDWKHLLP